MANQIGSTGLSVDSLSTIQSKLLANFVNIYGEVNTDQNSPDAQWINIMAQMLADYGELLQDINASFDPDQAVGVVLDQRVKYNGITRHDGVYSTVEVTVSFDGPGTIKGVDLYSPEECFQVSDATGNILVPAVTTSGITADHLTVLFRALEYGALYFPAGSINTIITPTIGVESVSNEFSQITVGNNEESDSSLRLRRQVAAARVSSYGGIDSLVAAISQVEGVEFCTVIENDGTHDESSEANGENFYDQIPKNGIWIIIKGVYNYAEVANLIYQKRIDGTPMKGDITYDVARPNGRIFTAKWDAVTVVRLHVRITCRMYQTSFSSTNIVAALVAILFDVGEMADTTTINAKLKEQLPAILVNNLEISTDGETWGKFIIPNFNEELVIEDSFVEVTEG